MLAVYILIGYIAGTIFFNYIYAKKLQKQMYETRNKLHKLVLEAYAVSMKETRDSLTDRFLKRLGMSRQDQIR